MEKSVRVYEITAYDFERRGIKGGAPEVVVLAQVESAMDRPTKAEARRILAEHLGRSLPRGCVIDWQQIAVETYTLTLEGLREVGTLVNRTATV